MAYETIYLVGGPGDGMGINLQDPPLWLSVPKAITVDVDIREQAGEPQVLYRRIEGSDLAPGGPWEVTIYEYWPVTRPGEELLYPLDDGRLMELYLLGVEVSIGMYSGGRLHEWQDTGWLKPSRDDYADLVTQRFARWLQKATTICKQGVVGKGADEAADRRLAEYINEYCEAMAC